ncbi:MAG: O-antigen ligase family protein [Flavobacteriales bacterium]|nr:O-antigen ligase family protein [Flavobacteriales bacterium]
MAMNDALRSLFAEGGGALNDRWRLLSVCLFAFALALAPNVLPLLLAVMVATYLIDRRPWSHRPLIQLDWRAPSPWLLLYFLLHVAGMCWTTNQDFGWFDLGIKLPLLVLPLLAMMPGLRPSGRDAALLSFCFGNAVAVLLFAILATIRIVAADGAGPEEFLSSRFSPGLHPSYFAWYLATALVVLLIGGTGARLPRRWRLVLLLVLCLGIVLTQSRMGWITLPVVLVWALLHGWNDRWMRRVLLLLLLVSVLGGSLLTLLSPGVRARMVDLVEAVSAPRDDAGQSAAIRTVVWRSAREVAVAHWPWGTGTGDVKDELVKRYAADGALKASEQRLNAHSQFLQSLVALGLPGLLGLALALVLPFVSPGIGMPDRAVRRAALLIMAMNLAVESMLEVQAGVLFAAFLAWVLWWPTASVPSSRS